MLAGRSIATLSPADPLCWPQRSLSYERPSQLRFHVWNPTIGTTGQGWTWCFL